MAEMKENLFIYILLFNFFSFEEGWGGGLICGFKGDNKKARFYLCAFYNHIIKINIKKKLDPK